MIVAISKIFIVSSNNDLIVSHDYKNDVDDSSLTDFMVEIKPPDQTNIQPHFVKNGVHYYYITRNKVYFGACSPSELFPIMVFEMLSRLYHICKDFCGVVSDQSLQANLLLVYEILQEFMVEGYVQLESSEKIRPYIQSTPVVVHVEKSPVRDMSSRMFGIESKLSPSSSSRPITQAAGGADKSGFYVDVIEKMVATVAADGTISHMEVNGSVVVRNFLTSSTQFKMFFNSDLVVAEPSLKGYGTQVQLDRCSFHECVSHDEFITKRYIVLAPPVGEFSALTYTVSGELCLNQPFILRTFVSEVDGSRDLRVTLRLKSNFPSRVTASTVMVKLPVPKCVASISSKLSTDQQSADLNKEEGAVTWTVKKMPGQSEYIAEFRLNNQGTSAITRRDIDPVNLEFEISGYTASGLVIKHLKAHSAEKIEQQQLQQQQPKHFVRLITVSESYMLRTF